MCVCARLYDGKRQRVSETLKSEGENEQERARQLGSNLVGAFGRLVHRVGAPGRCLSCRHHHHHLFAFFFLLIFCLLSILCPLLSSPPRTAHKSCCKLFFYFFSFHHSAITRKSDHWQALKSRLAKWLPGAIRR